MKHTPGPWAKEWANYGPWKQRPPEAYVRIRATDGHKDVAKVYVRRTKTNNLEEAEANACLIAAAPYLLQVCKGALGYLEALPVFGRPDEPWFKPLRAAIAKAEGLED